MLSGRMETVGKFFSVLPALPTGEDRRSEIKA
jgi:hypothetical protein